MCFCMDIYFNLQNIIEKEIWKTGYCILVYEYTLSTVYNSLIKKPDVINLIDPIVKFSEKLVYLTRNLGLM